jgi:ribA/ribD-fused uncharacterized protein
MPTGVKKLNRPKRARKGSSDTNSSGLDTPQKKKTHLAIKPKMQTAQDKPKPFSIPEDAPEWFASFDLSVKKMSDRLDKVFDALQIQNSEIKSQNTDIKELALQIKDLCTANGMLEDRINTAESNSASAVDKVSELEETISELQKQNKTLCTQMLSAENYSKKCNLKFYNISETQRESTSDLTKKLAEVFDIMEVNMDRMMISNFHRLPSSAPGPRPIVIKFCTYFDRDLVWSHRHFLREKNIKVYVSEHYNNVVEANIRKLNPIRKAAVQSGMRAKLVADKLVINGNQYTVETTHLLPVSLQPATLAERNLDGHTFFFHESSPYSNFHPAPFKVDSKQFVCAEQYIQYRKAIIFGDTSSAAQIMGTTSPYLMKSLGNKVCNFTASSWLEQIPGIAKTALLAKFGQNQSLKDKLLKTENILVEAAPKDKTWGIGIHLKDPNILLKKREWGSNLLGKALMEVRACLKL